ncbi:VC0807 family protein [Streptomyces rimosus]|uniref:VC0807 family protein n=1 Tax=Streptomyces rimosus TaxID=1927 RepID=UPI00067DF101|nr:VC0807 family protein [Streptomyces rimosus]
MRKAATAGGRTPQAPTPNSGLGAALRPLIIDVAVPLALFYVLSDLVHLSTVKSLVISGLVPAVRTLFGLVTERRINGLAILMLVVTLVGAGISAITGDARLMLAKESLGTGLVGLSLLVSAFTPQPLMASAMRPFMTKGDPVKDAAWQHLRDTSPQFRSGISKVTLVWGIGLLGDCVLRVVGAYTLPVDTMVWMSNVILLGAIAVLAIVGGKVNDKAEKLLEDEAARRSHPAPPQRTGTEAA